MTGQTCSSQEGRQVPHLGNLKQWRLKTSVWRQKSWLCRCRGVQAEHPGVSEHPSPTPGLEEGVRLCMGNESVFVPICLCPCAPPGVCVGEGGGRGRGGGCWFSGRVSQSSYLLLPAQELPTLLLHLGSREPQFVANPSLRLRKEDPPCLPPRVAPRLPPLPHSTGILFLGGTEKTVRTQGLGGGSSALGSGEA